MTITLGLDAAQCSRVPVVVGAPAVFRRVLPACRGLVEGGFADRGSDRLLGRSGEIIALGGGVVSQRRSVITQVGRAVSFIGRVIAPVSSVVTFRSTRASVVVIRHVCPDAGFADCSEQESNRALGSRL